MKKDITHSVTTSDEDLFEAQVETTRRNFLSATLTGAAMLGAGSLIAAPAVMAQETDEKDPGSGLTEQDIASTEKLMAVEYTSEERGQILASIDEQLDNIRALRALKHANIVAPACIFSPKLPGKDFAAQVDQISLEETNIGKLPKNTDDIAFSPVVHLAHWIKTGQMTSRELTEIYLTRIKAHGAKVECFITVTSDLARKQAEAADKEIKAGKYRGPLHGIPYGVKDLMDSKDIRTTWGAAPYKDRVADQNAAVVDRLADAGAVLIGKTTCGALAYGDIWFDGVTRNPWNLGEGSSGSSAGSASATGAGLVGFAIGTETLGSIVSPSHRCGVTGLRPTFGRVSRHGTMALCWSLDKIGPICRAVEDTALVLSAINGADVRDASSIGHGFQYNGKEDISKFRVGYDPDWFGERASDNDRAALETAKRLGLNLVKIKLDQWPIGAMVPNLLAESAAAFEELTLSNRDDDMVWQEDRAWPNGFRQARFFSSVDFVQADRLRRQVMLMMDRIFNEVDVIIGPNFAGNMLTITNYTGHPQVTLRAGFADHASRSLFKDAKGDRETKRRVPENFSVWGQLFGEGKALAVARALEKEFGVRDQRPKL